MHAVIDSERRERNTAEEQVRRGRQISIDAAKAQSAHSYLVAKKDTSVANPERQRGNALTLTQFMTKLHKLNRDLVAKPHPHKADKSVLYLRVGDQELLLFPMESEFMPEWSVMAKQKVKSPTSSEFWDEVEIPGAEIQRGWRTVLARLIEKRILVADAVEREFGTPDRQSWAVLTGKVNEILPI